MMKRIVSLTLVVLMIAALFVGCGSNGPEGTWKVKTIDGEKYSEYVDAMVSLFTAFAGDELKMSESEIKSLFEKAGSFTLKADGTAESIDLDEETMTETTKTGTWKLDGEKITITIDGSAIEGTLKDGKITVEEDGHTMVLEK